MTSEAQVTWADMYGGPGDGERVPMSATEVIPTYPYLVPEHEALYWYLLYERPDGSYCYVLHGLRPHDSWIERHDIV